jgi:hypothetical protein
MVQSWRPAWEGESAWPGECGVHVKGREREFPQVLPTFSGAAVTGPGQGMTMPASEISHLGINPRWHRAEKRASGLKSNDSAGCCWLTPIILATHEAEIRGLWFKASLGK